MNATIIRLIWSGLCLTGGAALADNANVIPDRYPLSRYEETWKRASFALETPPQDAGNQLSFARDWAIVGATNLRGVDAVLLTNRKNKELIRLAQGEEVNGLKLLSVTQDPDPAKVKAVLQLGAETSQIGYDLSRLQSDPSPEGAKAHTEQVQAPAPPSGRDVTGSPGAAQGANANPRDAYSSRMPEDVENVVMTDGTKADLPGVRQEGGRRHLVLPSQVRPKPKPASGTGAPPN